MSTNLKDLNTYLDFPNTTSTFKNLIYKYQRKKKEDLEKKDKKNILKKVQAKIQQLENEERENDYIMNEVRRNAQINKEILYSFGTKALNHLEEIKKLNETTKIDKARFFEPDKELNLYELTEFKTTPNKVLKTKYMHDKIINLPKIRSVHKSEDKILYDSVMAMRQSILLLDKDKDKNKNKNNKNNNSIKNNKNTNFNNTNNLCLIDKKDDNRNLTLSLMKTPLKTEIEMNDSKKKQTINDFNKKRPIINNDYINYLQTIKTKFQKTEKRQERYFDRYKFGYEAYRMRYNYLKKIFFN